MELLVLLCEKWIALDTKVLGLLLIVEHLVEYVAEQVVIGRKELDQLLLLNMRELLDFSLRACLDSLYIGVKQTVVKDIR